MKKTTKTNPETKTVLTEEEKKAKRAAYAREYYSKHKEARIAAVKKCRAKKAVNGGSKAAETKKTAKPAPKKAVNPRKPATKKTAKPVETGEVKALRKAVEKAQKAVYKTGLALADAKDAYAVAKDTLKVAKTELSAKLKAAK